MGDRERPSRASGVLPRLAERPRRRGAGAEPLRPTADRSAGRSSRTRGRRSAVQRGGRQRPPLPRRQRPTGQARRRHRRWDGRHGGSAQSGGRFCGRRHLSGPPAHGRGPPRLHRPFAAGRWRHDDSAARWGEHRRRHRSRDSSCRGRWNQPVDPMATRRPPSAGRSPRPAGRLPDRRRRRIAERFHRQSRPLMAGNDAGRVAHRAEALP